MCVFVQDFPSIHPFSSPDSVFRSGFLGEQSKQSSLFSPTSSSSYLLHIKAFPSQSGDTICSACPGSAPGFPTGTKHLGCIQEASWVRWLNHLNCLALMWRSSSYTVSSTWKSQLLNLRLRSGPLQRKLISAAYILSYPYNNRLVPIHFPIIWKKKKDQQDWGSTSFPTMSGHFDLEEVYNLIKPTGPGHLRSPDQKAPHRKSLTHGKGMMSSSDWELVCP